MKHIETLRKIRNILYSIAGTDARTEKEAIISKYSYFTEFIEMLRYLYSPYIRTGIQEKKLEKFEYHQKTSFRNYEECLAYIAVYNTGTDEIVKNVNGFINKLPSDLREFFEAVVTKSLKIGVSGKTINKAYTYSDDIIPMFDVMLAKNYEKHKKKMWTKLITITPKLDGIRCIYRDGIFYTRQGRQIEGMYQLWNEMSILPQDYVYDGELMYNKPIKSNKRFRATTQIVRSDMLNKTDIDFHIFDMVKLEQWDKGKVRAPEFSKTRKDRLKNLLKESKLIHVKSVPIYYEGAYDESQIALCLKEAIKKDHEGIMINDAHATYQFKRTDKLLKLKKMQTCDLRVIGAEEGTGRNEGVLGALIVDYKGNVLKVGSGYSDLERQKIWNNRNKVKGKIIEVQYFEESKNRDGGVSLRFPVFLQFRNKPQPSYE